MKSLVKGIGVTIIILLTVLLISCVVAKSNRQYELDTSLNTAIHQTVKVVEDHRYSISTNEEFIAELNRNLLLQINSDSKIDIIIYDVDYQKGFIDTKVSLSFKYPHGTLGKVSTRKTMIIDDVENK